MFGHLLNREFAMANAKALKEYFKEMAGEPPGQKAHTNKAPQSYPLRKKAGDQQ